MQKTWQNTWRPLALLLLSLLGAVVSVYLTVSHLRHLATGEPSVCNLNQRFNCDVVNTSPYSEVFGVPIAHLGTLFYLGLGVLSLLALRRSELRPRLHGYLLLLSLLAVAYSVFLAGVSFKLGAVCVFCLSLYLINIGLFVLLLPAGGTALFSLPGQLFADVHALFTPSAFVLGLLFAICAVVSTVRVHAATTQAHAMAQARQRLPAEKLARLLSPQSPSLGNASAPVTIIEISDFECPFCQRASVTIAELLRLYPGKLRLVFHHFPLDTACNPLLKHQVHENACAAARAAVCAGEQGQFFPYAERLFQDGTEPADLRLHARALGLSEGAFSACLDSPRSLSPVIADITAASEVGVLGVPVFFINGRRLGGAQPLAAFTALIDAELAGGR